MKTIEKWRGREEGEWYGGEGWFGSSIGADNDADVDDDDGDDDDDDETHHWDTIPCSSIGKVAGVI